MKPEKQEKQPNWLPPREKTWPDLNPSLSLAVIPRAIVRINSGIKFSNNRDKLSCLERLLLFVLFTHQQDRIANVSLSFLKMATGCQKTTIKKILALLSSRGLIEIIPPNEKKKNYSYDISPSVKIINKIHEEKDLLKEEDIPPIKVPPEFNKNHEEEVEIIKEEVGNRNKTNSINLAEQIGKIATEKEENTTKNKNNPIFEIIVSIKTENKKKRISLDRLLSEKTIKDCHEVIPQRQSKTAYNLVAEKKLVQVETNKENLAVGLACLFANTDLACRNRRRTIYVYNPEGEFVATVTASHNIAFAHPFCAIVSTEKPLNIPRKSKLIPERKPQQNFL